MKRALGVLLSLTALVTACSSAKTLENKRLQAQNAYERGLTQARQGQSSLALSSLQEAVALDPGSALYHDSLGLMLLDFGRIDQAIAELNTSVELDPNRGDSMFHLGTALAEARRWEEAVAAYRKAILQPTLTVLDLAHQNLGLAFFHLKRYREAEDALRYALSLDPQLQAAYYNLGLVLIAQKRPTEAKAALKRAQQLAPDSPFGQAAVERLKALGDGG
jgi:tetratricopeptide (TPR) repeat protein